MNTEVTHYKREVLGQKASAPSTSGGSVVDSGSSTPSGSNSGSSSSGNSSLSGSSSLNGDVGVIELV